MPKMLNLIQNSKVYEAIKPTPLEKAENLSLKLNTNIYLKREDTTLVYSFKIRGAYNKIAHLSESERSRGIICASAGNHAQGVAYSAKKMGTRAVIVMPATTPEIKVDAVKKYGAEVVLFGDNYSEAGDRAKKLQKQLNLTYIHPFDDELVIAGQGTVGLELLEQLSGLNLSYIFVPVGGGGLLAGILSLVKQLKPDVKIIAVEPEDSNCLQSAIEAGRPVELGHVGIFADGVAVKQIGDKTFSIIKDKVDGIITVNNDQIALAIKQIFEENRTLVEPAGALSLAGLIKFSGNLKPEDVSVAIISGANIAFERLQFITERTMLASGQELLLNIKLKEEPGSLKSLLSDVIKKHNITEFAYRKDDAEAAQILVGVGVKSEKDAESFKQNLLKFNYQFEDVSSDDLTITHLRHMAGGGSLRPIVTEQTKEAFLDCAFPERPGALAEFLSKMSGTWNISLFHYRGLGGDTGKVLVGIEVPNSDKLKFSKFISGLNQAGFKVQKAVAG